jgi:(p)ppGpp synthase/HD superfamily hydrolase
MTQPNIILGPRLKEAFSLALDLHSGQTRKTNGTPYLQHLLGVCALVLQDGGDEDEAIAALLHDGPEDQGGEETLALIREQFGENVARIVSACSDTFEDPKPPWRQRKEVHMAKWAMAPKGAKRVLTADKLHNAMSLLGDLRARGPEIWPLFNGGEEGTLWYYRAVHNMLSVLHPGPMADDLDRVVSEIEYLAAQEA